MQTKSVLRQNLLAQRRAMSPRQVRDASGRIVSALLKQVADGQRVFCYVSQGHEVGTHDLIQQGLARSWPMALPRIGSDGVMRAIPVTSWDQLSPGRWGILEPTSDGPAWDSVDLCVLPCVAATVQGHRLGRGGGYYDRWLAAHRAGCAIALAYAWQVVEALPTDSWDQPMDAVVTEQGWADSRPTG